MCKLFVLGFDHNVKVMTVIVEWITNHIRVCLRFDLGVVVLDRARLCIVQDWLGVTPRRQSKLKCFLFSLSASAKFVVMVVEHNWNADDFVDVVIEMTCRPHRCFVIVLYCESVLATGR